MAAKQAKPVHVPATSAVALAPLELRRWNLNAIAIWTFGGLILILPLAEILLRWTSSQAAGNEMTDDRARFWVINALTLTGFQSPVSLKGNLVLAQGLIFTLTLIGILFSLIIGGLATVRILRLKYSDPQVVRFSLITCLTLILLGAMGLVQTDRSPMEALMLSASALGNSGVCFSPLPGLRGWQTHVILLPLAVMGSLGLPVLLELADLLRHRNRLSFHSQTVLRMTAGLYLLGLAAIFLPQLFSLDTCPSFNQTTDLAISSSTLSINARTAGLPYQFASDFPRLVQWITIVLMAIGANSASTGGGLKTTTIVELFRGTRRCLGGQAPGRGFGVALLWLGIYLALASLVFGLLLCTDRQLPPDRLAFETISAVSNAGLSFDQIMMVNPGLDVLSAGMFLGRLAPLAMLCWMANTTQDADLAIG